MVKLPRALECSGMLLEGSILLEAAQSTNPSAVETEPKDALCGEGEMLNPLCR